MPGGASDDVAVAPAPIIEFRAAGGTRHLAHLRKLVRRRVTAIGMPRRKQLLDHFGMTRRAGELVNRLAIPGDAEPAEAVEDGVDRRLGRALAVGILDLQQHLAAAPARIQPIEQRGARAANMQKTSRRRCEARNDRFSHAGRLKSKRRRLTRACVAYRQEPVPMLIQVIHCHPLTDSYNHALFKTIVAALEQKGR